MKRRIYLIGQISSDPITYEWRSNIEKAVTDMPERFRKEIELINPCGNAFSQGVLEASEFDTEKFTQTAYGNDVSNLLPAQDCGFVMYSNAFIANMNLYDPERPLLGTIFELAWYYLTPWKVGVGIFNGNPEEDYNCRHPFAWNTIKKWVKNEYEAIEVFNKLYCG